MLGLPPRRTGPTRTMPAAKSDVSCHTIDQSHQFSVYSIRAGRLWHIETLQTRRRRITIRHGCPKLAPRDPSSSWKNSVTLSARNSPPFFLVLRNVVRVPCAYSENPFQKSTSPRRCWNNTLPCAIDYISHRRCGRSQTSTFITSW